MRSSVKIKKIWEDVDFFELHIEFNAMECSANLDIYTTNEELILLKQGIVNFLNRSEKEFEWTSG